MDVTHEVVLQGADVLHFAPIVGLEDAARLLLGIWDALQLVEVRRLPLTSITFHINLALTHFQINRLACLRLTERCAAILMSVREEIAEAGDELGHELEGPVERLVQCVRSQSHGVKFRRTHDHTQIFPSGAHFPSSTDQPPVPQTVPQT